MCISLAARQPSTSTDESQPLVIPFPQSFTEGFDPSQSKARGAISWNTLFSTSHLAAGIASLPSDGSGTLGLHRHVQPELYYMLSGAAVVEIEGKRHRVTKGMTIFVPGDAEHGVVQDVSKGGDVCTWLYVFPSSFEEVEYRFRSEGAYGETIGKGDDGKVVKAKL
jgi:hypothetical protein